MNRTRIHKLAVSVCLVFAVSSVQAAEPLVLSLPPGFVASNAGEGIGSGVHSGVQETVRSGSRYGIGYEARQAIGAGGQGDRGSQIERSGRIGIERGGRGGRAK